MPVLRCARCGGIFGLSKPDKRIKLCPKCSKGPEYIPVVKMYATCEECGVRFRQDRKDQKFCCAECRRVWYRRKYSEEHKHYDKTCRWCRTEFDTTDSQKEYCSESCRREARAHRDRKRYLSKKAKDKGPKG